MYCEGRQNKGPSGKRLFESVNCPRHLLRVNREVPNRELRGGQEGLKRGLKKAHKPCELEANIAHKPRIREGLNSGEEKAHKHKHFRPVVLGATPECPGDNPGLSLGQTHFVPGTNPGFLLSLHNGSPVCPLGQSRGRRAAEKVYVSKVSVPFSLAISCEVQTVN